MPGGVFRCEYAALNAALHNIEKKKKNTWSSWCISVFTLTQKRRGTSGRY